MKKLLLTAILVGGTLFAANAGDFVLNLPGFFLKVEDGHTVIRHCPPRHVIHRRPLHHRHVRPAPPPKRHRQEGHHGHHGKRR